METKDIFRLLQKEINALLALLRLRCDDVVLRAPVTINVNVAPDNRSAVDIREACIGGDLENENIILKSSDEDIVINCDHPELALSLIAPGDLASVRDSIEQFAFC